MRCSVTLAIAAIGLVGASTLVPAAQPGAPPAGYAASTIPGVTFSLSGGGSATSSLMFGAQKRDELLFFAGDEAQQSLCWVGASTGRRPVLPGNRKPLVIWRVTGTLQSFDGATAMIAITWRREVAGAGVEPGSDFEETFVWRAEEGASRVLDFVRPVPATTAAGCDAKTLDMRFIVSGPDNLAEAAIAYDIWLLQPKPSGGREVERLSTSGAQGSSAAFAFPTLKLDAPQPKSGSSPLSLSMRVEGRIMGRVRPDGRIDLAVDAGRMVGPWGRGLSSGSIGRTRLIVTSGETVELEPPPLYGGGHSGPYDAVFQQARTAIRVRAKRLW